MHVYNSRAIFIIKKKNATRIKKSRRHGFSSALANMKKKYVDSRFDAFSKEFCRLSVARVCHLAKFFLGLRFLGLFKFSWSSGTRVESKPVAGVKLFSNYSENRLLSVARSREGVSPEDVDGSYL